MLKIDQKHKCKLLDIKQYRFMVLKISYGWKNMLQIWKTEFAKNVKNEKKWNNIIHEKPLKTYIFTERECLARFRA